VLEDEDNADKVIKTFMGHEFHDFGPNENKDEDD